MILQSIVALVVFVFFICFLASIYLVRMSLKPRTHKYEETYEMEVQLGWFTKEYFELLPKVEEYLTSPYGYKIHGFWIPNKGAKKSIILAHGFTYTLFGSVKYVEVFRKLGYNVFVYDHRYHGLSGGKNSTYGLKEKKDLLVIVDYIKRITGKDSVVGTHGESLGGATVLQHAAIDERVDFVITDCSYANLSLEFRQRLQQDYKLPAFPILYMASFINWIVTGAFYHQVAPVKAAAKIKVPVMVIHGESDDYTPIVHGQMIYDALKGSKYKYFVEEAGHAGALGVNRKQYYLEVKKFLNDNDIGLIKVGKRHY